MTKVELRDAKIAEGFNIQPLNLWLKVSEINNVSKYDVGYEKDGIFKTAYVKVVDDGTENEVATVIANLEEVSTFGERLKTFMLSKEVDPVFAIARKDVVVDDAFALVDVYADVTGGVSKKTYAVKERNDTFTFKEVI